MKSTSRTLAFTPTAPGRLVDPHCRHSNPPKGRPFVDTSLLQSEAMASPDSRASDELRFRLSPDDKALITEAAAIQGVSISSFVRDPAVDRAKQVLAEASLRHVTVLPADEFDALMASLDLPVDPKVFDRARALLPTLPLDPA